jgi:MFS family permease
MGGGERIWTRSFILLCIGNLFMAMAFYQLLPVLPVYIMQELHGDKSEVGAILAAFTLSALIIRPFTGIALDRLGRKWIFLLSLLAFSFMFSGYIFAASLLTIALIRLFHGFAWGITTTSGSTVVVDIVPRSRMGEGIGFYGLSMTLAMALGPLLGIWVTKGGHYEWIFFETAIMSMLFFLLATMVKYPEYTAPEGKPSYRLADLFEVSSLRASLNMLLLMIPYGGVISFIAIYGEERGLPEVTAGFFIVCAVGIAITRYFAGRIFDRIGPRQLMITAISAEMICFPLLVFTPGITGFYICGFLLGFAVGTAWPTAQSMVNAMVQHYRRGAANSTLFTAVDLGIGTGMFGLGMLGNLIGLNMSFLLCALICFMALLHYVFIVNPAYLASLKKVQAE